MHAKYLALLALEKIYQHSRVEEGARRGYPKFTHSVQYGMRNTSLGLEM